MLPSEFIWIGKWGDVVKLEPKAKRAAILYLLPYSDGVVYKLGVKLFKGIANRSDRDGEGVEWELIIYKDGSKLFNGDWVVIGYI